MFLLAWTSMSTGVWQKKKPLHNSASAYESTYARLHSAPDLQESSRFNYSFFLFLTSSHHSLSLWGAERSQRSLYSGSGLATRSSGLQKNSYSLWHMLRRSIISLFLILSRALSSPFSPVRSVFTGACKITWQEQLKALDRTSVPSVPQTFTNFFFVSLK